MSEPAPGTRLQEVVISNELGLHTRAATRFVQTAGRFRADVEIEKDGQVVSGKSILSVLLLVAAKGTRLRLRARGDDADAALQALKELVDGKFGEDR